MEKKKVDSVQNATQESDTLEIEYGITENSVECVIDEAEAQKIIEKYDAESRTRQLKGLVFKIAFALGICWTAFQLYTAIFGVLPSTLQRAPHLAAAMAMVFLYYPASKKGLKKHRPSILDCALVLLSVGCGAYHVFFYKAIVMRAGMYTTMDVVVSVVAVLLLLEAGRRTAGPVIIGIDIVFLLYAVFGHKLSGLLQHNLITFQRVFCYEYLGTEGILGITTYVSSTFIFLFMVFAAFLKASGAGPWFTNLAVAVCGGATGGPAKAAVVASALQGTISGSAIANVVGTGSVTIPLMKKTGYRGEFAGAVEAAASTGGQIMPPVMGAAAFIMAEFIGIPYGSVIAAAAIPAILYFTGIFMNVHFEALLHGLRGIPKERRPQIKTLLKRGWYLAAPVIAVFAALIFGRSAMRAALLGILSCIVVWIVEIVRNTGKFDFKKFIVDFVKCLNEGAKSAMPIAVICGCAGIIVGSVTLTGLGLRLASILVKFAHGNLALTLVFTAICSIILGMGLPTTACYIVQATIAAPALVMLGVPVIAAHMFVFYFGLAADITPPVCMSAYAGASLAQANPLRTGFTACRLGIAAYLVPFIFAYNPILLLVNTGGHSIPIFILLTLKALVTAMIGMAALASGFTGLLRVKAAWWERIVLIAVGVMLIDPNTLTDIIGISLFAIILVHQNAKKKKLETVNIIN